MGTLLLVRHGQASAFEDNYDRLSILGEKQARLLGETWRRRELKLDRIFTGPRVRQHRTAEIAAEAGGLPAPVVLPELDEMQVEPLFREHLPDLFARHAHLQVLGDAMLLREMLENLIDNAIRYSSEGGIVTTRIAGWRKWIERPKSPRTT